VVPPPNRGGGTADVTAGGSRRQLAAARAGKWTGHGQDLETGELDIEFEGKDPNAIFECIRAALKGRPLAKLGWCLLSPEYEGQQFTRRDLRE
jgi:hypothetical protein